MGMLIDPYGAAEFFATGCERTRLCDNVLRLAFFATEDGSHILRVKVLMPIDRAIEENRMLTAFLVGRTARLIPQ